MLGVFWSVVQPVFMLSVYVFVFGFVFKARWGEAVVSDQTSYALALFCGLTLHGAFAEVLARSSTTIVGQASYVKRVVFPLQVLPLVQVCAAMWQFGITVFILFLGVLFLGPGLGWWSLFSFMIFIPLVLLLLGLSWFFSAIAVYIRDIAHLMGLVITLLLFLSPVFYTLEMIPEPLRNFMYLNPLTSLIELFRAAVLLNEPPSLILFTPAFLLSLLVFFAGYHVFNRLRPGFADVL